MKHVKYILIIAQILLLSTLSGCWGRNAPSGGEGGGSDDRPGGGAGGGPGGGPLTQEEARIAADRLAEQHKREREARDAAFAARVAAEAKKAADEEKAAKSAFEAAKQTADVAKKAADDLAKAAAANAGTAAEKAAAYKAAEVAAQAAEDVANTALYKAGNYYATNLKNSAAKAAQSTAVKDHLAAIRAREAAAAEANKLAAEAAREVEAARKREEKKRADEKAAWPGYVDRILKEMLDQKDPMGYLEQKLKGNIYTLSKQSEPYLRLKAAVELFLKQFAPGTTPAQISNYTGLYRRTQEDASAMQVLKQYRQHRATIDKVLPELKAKLKDILQKYPRILVKSGNLLGYNEDAVGSRALFYSLKEGDNKKEGYDDLESALNDIETEPSKGGNVDHKTEFAQLTKLYDKLANAEAQYILILPETYKWLPAADEFKLSKGFDTKEAIDKLNGEMKSIGSATRDYKEWWNDYIAKNL